MIFFHNAHSYTHFSYLYTKYNTSRQMKRIKTAILLAAAAVAITACNRKPVVPEFGMLPIDTLLGTQDNGCNIEYRFATIGNAGKSAALEAIEKANIEYFFELEEFAGTAREAADSAILQVAAEIVLPEGMSQGMGAYEISVESEGSVQDTLVTYSISRWSFTGGAHGMYGIEYHTYSITDGYELSLADLFTAPQLLGMEKLLREKLYAQYGTDNDEGLAEQGFFPEYIALTENFQITPEGITFYYNPYAIGCYALGAVEVAIGREELEQAGLDVPQVTKIAMALRRRGMDIDPAVYTIEELEQALLDRRGGGEKC